MKTRNVFVITMIILSCALMMAFSSCGSSKGGCYATKGMSGYHR